MSPIYRATRPSARLTFAALSAWLALAGPALAFDVVPSGFGTLGYAVSNRDARYERFIDEHGTLKRDSVFGLQLDARANAQWSATLQLRLAPSLKSDSRWDVQPAWGFVAWRPSDDWLLRAGRLRVPLYMHSESLDVGVTHDMARLPSEMYSVSPSNDFDGLSIGKTWQKGDGEFSVDAYHGRTKTTARAWLRDGVPGVQPAGAVFTDAVSHWTGIVLTLRQPGGQWRVGWHHALSRHADGAALPVSFPFVSIGPGLGYYQISDQLPGPGFATVIDIRNDILTFGVEQALPAGVRLAAEAQRTRQRDIESGSDTLGGYLALFRPFGSFTPYVIWSKLRSSSDHLDRYDSLIRNPLPDTVPGAASINAAQRAAAEGYYYVSDQRALALGSAWSFGAGQKVKLEWKRTRIGRASRTVDVRPGEDVRGTSIDIVSVNYNFAF